MKRSATLAALCLCLSAIPAHATEFQGYRIPESSRRRYDLSLGGDANSQSSNPTGSFSRVGSLRGDLSAGFMLGRDSDPLQWDASLRGLTSGQRTTGTRGAFSAVPSAGPPTVTAATSEVTRSRFLGESVQLGGGIRWYPGGARFGLEARGTIQGDYQQMWFSNETRSEVLDAGLYSYAENQSSNERWTYRETVSFEGAAGAGRVRDASTVFLAILLEERLQRDGKLARALSAGARQKVAELFSLRDGFSVVHNFPDKFFWGEIERLLREDGALAGAGLDAYAVMHLNEELGVLRSAFVRNVGWFVGPMIRASHSHLTVRTDMSSSSYTYVDPGPWTYGQSRSSGRVTQFSRALLAGGRAEYRKPVGPRTQADFAATALVKVSGDEELNVTSEARLQRLVAERWFAEVYAFHYRRIFKQLTPAADWGVFVGGSLAYYLEDYMRVQLSLDRGEGLSEAPGPRPRNHSVSIAARLGVSLGRGRLDAPGLLSQVRPMN